MDVVWIVIGIASLCMPHISAAPFGGSNAWSGLPFPAEALVVCLALFAVCRVLALPKTQELMPQFALWGAVVTIVFECVCAIALPRYCGSLALSFAGEMVHAGAVALWLAATALYNSEAKDASSPPLAVCFLLFASGVAWYVATAWVRSGYGAWDPTLEAAQWVAALLWALPVVVLLSTCSLETRSLAGLATLPFVGVLLGNRGWLLAVQAAGGMLADVPWQVLFVAPALSFAAFLCAVVLEAGEEPAEASDTENVYVDMESTIPLHLVAGSEKLSAREREVVLLVLAGLGMPDVAERCGVALSTARTYLLRAYDKMGVAGTAEIAATMKGVVTTGEAPSAAGGEEPACPSWFTCDAQLSWQMLGCTTLSGLAVGLMATALVFGVQVPLALRFVLGAALSAWAAGVVLQGKRLEAGIVPVAAVSGALLVVCLVPHGIRAQLLLHGWGAYMVALAMLLVAFVLLRRAVSDSLAAIASVALVGDERVLAYLEGRGLKDYVARVALLTARDYPQGGIAKTLGLSRSTVTHYRRRAYEALDVANKEELIELLKVEAGL